MQLALQSDSMRVARLDRAQARTVGTVADTLASRLRRGDATAATEIYDLLGDGVRRVLRRFVGQQDVEDLVHDVFVEVFRSAAGLQHDDKLRSWVFGIAFNLARKHRRKSARMFRIFSREEAQPELSAGLGDTSSAHAQLSFELRKALSNLSEDARIVILLRFFEDCSIDEIAEATACSPATVKRRLDAAKESLTKVAQSSPMLLQRLEELRRPQANGGLS